jgi:hypothetical protein
VRWPAAGSHAGGGARPPRHGEELGRGGGGQAAASGKRATALGVGPLATGAEGRPSTGEEGRAASDGTGWPEAGHARSRRGAGCGGRGGSG